MGGKCTTQILMISNAFSSKDIFKYGTFRDYFSGEIPLLCAKWFWNIHFSLMINYVVLLLLLKTKKKMCLQFHFEALWKEFL